ncbi:TetR/AcrR family transcriptional regulator [Lujinxingia sediminis]|uniref:TetR/AcrR family transcriptional regulator n=1 Tax=Lujinxingia sediminis TaxID=2480984 RepID=A0ABY0CTG6_9DELT|nr:TetR/AcrR family transcriptional regulator [Lujinxingia sediminis]RVU44830.1 TetR/AcrR family transcriptional regulator [Lujinxingia sediminis]
MSVVRTRFEKLDGERQEEILEAAGEEFAERGYESASVNQIIRRAKISKGSLYYYFEDKADLFATVFTRASERFLSRLGGFDVDALTEETFWSEIERMGRLGLEALRRDTWYVRLVRSLKSGGAGGISEKAAAKVQAWGERHTERVLERGRELGLVREDVPLEWLVTMTMAMGEASDRWMLEHIDAMEGGDVEVFLMRALDAYRRLWSPAQRGSWDVEAKEERR